MSCCNRHCCLVASCYNWDKHCTMIGAVTRKNVLWYKIDLSPGSSSRTVNVLLADGPNLQTSGQKKRDYHGHQILDRAHMQCADKNLASRVAAPEPKAHPVHSACKSPPFNMEVLEALAHHMKAWNISMVHHCSVSSWLLHEDHWRCAMAPLRLSSVTNCAWLQ